MQQKSELASRRKLANFCHIRLACTADNDVLCFLGARGRELRACRRAAARGRRLQMRIQKTCKSCNRQKVLGDVVAARSLVVVLPDLSRVGTIMNIEISA